jgi:arylsulfatase
MSPDRAISPALPRRQRLLAALLAAAIATLSACGSDAPPGTSTGTVADNGTPTTPARKPNILYLMADDLG